MSKFKTFMESKLNESTFSYSIDFDGDSSVDSIFYTEIAKLLKKIGNAKLSKTEKVGHITKLAKKETF